ncbi:MAG: ABC transporter ATP-binding protein, partial [Anaerolineales bacterium]
LQTTFIYVTHDQVEAMTMATRIAVINHGILQQVDTPQHLYDNPDNLFVAGFIGSPAMNFFPAKLRTDNGKLMVDTGPFAIAIPDENAKPYQAHAGKNVIFGMRPENIHDPKFTPPNIHTANIEAKVDVTELMGNEIFMHMLSGQNSFVARVDPRSNMHVGEKVEIAFDMDSFHVFDAETEEAIR